MSSLTGYFAVSTFIREESRFRTVSSNSRAISIMKDCAMLDFEFYPISTPVNTPKNQDEKLIEPVAA